MAEKNVKFPKFLIYLLIIPAVAMTICMFINAQAVGVIYFIALLISVVFFVIDKYYGTYLTNYRQTFMLSELINLVAVIAIIYHEFASQTLILNIFLSLLVFVECAMLVIDAFFIKNKNITKYECVLVDLFKIGSMICILTYFYKVSTFWYSIIALVFELVNLGFKIFFAVHKQKETGEIKTPSEELEDRIHSAGEDEGETE